MAQQFQLSHNFPFILLLGQNKYEYSFVLWDLIYLFDQYDNEYD